MDEETLWNIAAKVISNHPDIKPGLRELRGRWEDDARSLAHAFLDDRYGSHEKACEVLADLILGSVRAGYVLARHQDLFDVPLVEQGSSGSVNSEEWLQGLLKGIDLDL